VLDYAAAMPELRRAPLRADARRNRDAILRAAREVLAEQGLEASLDAIARRAGVGRATLYRRFPTREDLVSAIFDDNMDELSRLAETHDDRGTTFYALLERTADLQRRDLGFIQALTRGASPEIVGDIVSRFVGILAGPLLEARDAGTLREDFERDDVILLIEMLGGAAHGGAQARGLALLRDALAPRRDGPAPRSAPPRTRDPSG
jgi:AcrR family transcriptional regulator